MKSGRAARIPSAFIVWAAGTMFLVPGAGQAAFFAGDLVYCDSNADGAFDPAAGDFPLDGVDVRVVCRDAAGEVCADLTATTGTPHPSTDDELHLYAQATTWDPTIPPGDPNSQWAGRYLVELSEACFNPFSTPRPWACTIEVVDSTLPEGCNQLVTPRANGFPLDANRDRDFCDVGVDGPFPEGQPLGNLPEEGTCEAFPSPAPGDGIYTDVFPPVYPVQLERHGIHNDFGYRAPIVPFDLDIRPGSCPNSWNRANRGVLSVALLGSPDFDVAQVDVSSVVISRADRVGGSVGPNLGPNGPPPAFQDLGTPLTETESCGCHELEGDGIPDLSLHFPTERVIDGLEMQDVKGGTSVELMVSGWLLDGTPFAASDCVRLVPPGSSPRVHIRANVAGDCWIEASPVDERLDGGGFTDFERTYPRDTVVTLTARRNHDGRDFRGWRVDGAELISGETTLSFTANGSSDQTIEAEYAVKPASGSRGWGARFLR